MLCAQSGSGANIPVHLEPDPRRAGIFTLSSALPVSQDVLEPILADTEDIALVLHTSGTTSRPEIVPLTHANLFYSVHNIAGTYRLTPADTCLNMMPLFHIHGLVGGALGATGFPAEASYAPRDLLHDQVFGWLNTLAPTWYSAVPTIHQSILDQVHHQPGFTRNVHLRFIRSCSSSLARNWPRNWKKVSIPPCSRHMG